MATSWWSKPTKADYSNKPAPSCRRAFPPESGKIETETIWLISSLSVEQAGPERLLELARAYWGIENGTHRPLDTVCDEDRCRVRHPVAATVLGLMRRLLHGEARAWARGQARARDRTFPTYLARHENDRLARLRTVTTGRGGL